MSLSCSCDFDPGDYDDDCWWWEDHSSMIRRIFSRRKRCCSCNDLIGLTEDSIRFFRYRNTKTDIEERIHGDFVRLASYYMCEECSGLYLALDELGYGCLDITTPMKDYVAEYNEMRNETD